MAKNKKTGRPAAPPGMAGSYGMPWVPADAPAAQQKLPPAPPIGTRPSKFGGMPKASDFTWSDPQAPGMGWGDLPITSGNLLDPNRTMVDPGEDVYAPDYMAIFNDMLASMTPPKPQMSFDASPFQAAIGQANQQAGIGRAAIGDTQNFLMNQLGQIRGVQEQMGVKNLAALQGGQGQVNQNIQGAIDPVAADLAAQGVTAQLGGGARAAALAGQQAAQTNRMNVGQQSAMMGMDERIKSGEALGQSANQTLGSNLATAISGIEHDQLKAQTSAQNDYIRALNSWQKGRSGDAKSVLSMIADTIGSDVADKWANESGPTADAVAAGLASLETKSASPSQLLGELNKKVWVPQLDNDGNEMKNKDGSVKQRYVTYETVLKEKGTDTTQYRKAIQEYGKPPKMTKQQKAISAIYGSK